MKTWLLLACIEACSLTGARLIDVDFEAPPSGSPCRCDDSIEKFYTSTGCDLYEDETDNRSFW